MPVQRRCPLCLQLVKGRCLTCRPETDRQYDQHRGTASQRGYDKDWRRFRRQMLAERPLCQDCEATGQTTAAAEVHHILKLRDNYDLRLEPTNVMCLCKACHSRRTARGE